MFRMMIGQWFSDSINNSYGDYKGVNALTILAFYVSEARMKVSHFLRLEEIYRM